MIANEQTVLDVYTQLDSVKGTSRKLGISEHAVVKILCHNGIYPTSRALEIHDLIDNGTALEDLPDRLKISAKALCKYLPYQRGTYLTDIKTRNARTIAAFRARRKAAFNENE